MSNKPRNKQTEKQIYKNGKKYFSQTKQRRPETNKFTKLKKNHFFVSNDANKAKNKETRKQSNKFTKTFYERSKSKKKKK